MQQKIQIPEKLVPVFTGNYRYRGAYGGRGSAKSRTFAKMSAVHLLRKGSGGKKFLCCREFQNSLKDSVYAEIKMAIQGCWLSDYYQIGRDYIRCNNGGEFIFYGLHHNMDSVKSTAGIIGCWVEEAETVSEESWRELIPTIREPGSEIWLTWNPKIRDVPTDKRFLQTPPPNSIIVEMNWRDNPWFPAELEAERLDHQKRYPQTYNHVWEGDYLESTETHPFLSHRTTPRDYDVMDLDRVISIDHSQCVGGDYFVMIEQGRDYDGHTHIVDLYRTNTASIQDRLEKVASFVRRRRPRVLVVENTSESKTFIDVLRLYLNSQDLSIGIEAPTASSRGSKNDYITSWLVPLFENNTIHCNVASIFDTIHSEMAAFSMDSKNNLDDTLDTIASGVRYLKTPARPKVEPFQDTGIPQIDRQRRKLRDALTGKRKSRQESFI